MIGLLDTPAVVYEAPMYPSVRAEFLQFTKGFEGDLDFMYLDAVGLVTTGYGNLIDSPEAARAIAWVHKDSGAPATDIEVGAEWVRVKGHRELAGHGGGAFAAVTTLRATAASIAALVDRMLASNEVELRKHFPEFDRYPADAQLGIHSMAWALGAAFAQTWPHFMAAVRAEDWDRAADESKISEVANRGIKPRNVANRTLFENAAHVLEQKLPLDVLYYPRVLDAGEAPPSLSFELKVDPPVPAIPDPEDT